MATIIYGGVHYLQTRHAMFCRKCLTTVESKTVHDLKICPCGSVGVDGGVCAGNRILGDLKDMEPRSIYVATVGTHKILLPQAIIEKHHRSLEAAHQNDIDIIL